MKKTSTRVKSRGSVTRRLQVLLILVCTQLLLTVNKIEFMFNVGGGDVEDSVYYVNCYSFMSYGARL